MQLVITDNFAQSIIILFAVALGIFVIFSALVYLYSSQLVNKWINLNPKYTFWKQLGLKLFLGITLGLVSFLLIKLQYWLDFQGIIIFYVPLLLVVGLLFSLFTSFVATIPILIYSLAVQLTDTVNGKPLGGLAIAFPFIILLIGYIWITIMLILKISRKTLLILVTNIVYFSVCILIAFLMLHKNPLKVMSIELLINSILFMIFYIVLLWLYNFFNKLQKLSKAVLYEKQYFLNSVKAESIIKDKLNKDNVNLGLMVIFSFSNIDKLPIQLGNYASTYVQKILLEKIVKNFNNIDVLFYLTQQNEYACFFFLKDFDLNELALIYKGNNNNRRYSNDPFYDVYQGLNSVPNNIHYNDLIEQINLNASGAIYGLHSCSFKQLEHLCRITRDSILPSQRKNILQIYDPSEIIDVKRNYDEINKLNNFFNPDEFEVHLSLADPSPFNNVPHLWNVNISCVNHLLFDYGSIKRYAVANDIWEITQRLIAMQCLQEFTSVKKQIHKSKILIPYPLPVLLNPYFNLPLFVKKITILNLDLSDIIFELDLDDLNVEYTNVFDKMQDLQKLKAKFYFINFDETRTKILNYIKPDYIAVKPLTPGTKVNINEQKNYYQKITELLSQYELKPIF